MIKQIKYINWDSVIFAGFYDSYLYNSDKLYDLSERDDLKNGECYDFYVDEQGNYTFELFQKAVAKECTKALFKNIMQSDNKIIFGMRFIALHCPRFYNFETDKLEIEITLDWDKLLVWVQENCGAFNQYLHDNFTSRDGFTSFVPNNYNEFFDFLNQDFERLSQVVIEFYILQNFDDESYEYDCYDIADDLIMDYVKITKDDE